MAGRSRRALRSAWEGSLHPGRRKRAIALVSEAPIPDLVLVLCLGNVCRSPYAEARLLDALANKGMDVDVESAGFLGANRPPPSNALSAAAARGLDTRAHRSQLLTHDLAERADLTVLVEGSHARRITPRRWLSKTTVVVLGDFDPDPVKSRTIPDPWGKSAETFDEVFDRIDRCVEVLAGSLGKGWVESGTAIGDGKQDRGESPRT